MSERRFGGIARLYGQDAYSSFQSSHVIVVGIGGVGTWATEALSRTGIGALTLIDLDSIAESNTNRQLHALENQFGRAKVEAMAERIGQINPKCRVHMIEDFVTPENVAQLLSDSPDVVVDAIDQTRVKVAIAAWCKEAKISVVTAGAAGGRIDPTRVCVSDLARTTGDALLSRVRQQLRKRHGFPRGEKSKFNISAVHSSEPMKSSPLDCDPSAGLSCAGYGSASVVTGTFGLVAAAEALRLLTSKKSK